MQEHEMAGITREPAKLKGAVNDENTEFGVWQQIVDRVLATNDIWRAIKQSGMHVTFPVWHM